MTLFTKRKKKKEDIRDPDISKFFPLIHSSSNNVAKCVFNIPTNVECFQSFTSLLTEWTEGGECSTFVFYK
jgi:hypothetical protein